MAHKVSLLRSLYTVYRLFTRTHTAQDQRNAGDARNSEQALNVWMVNRTHSARKNMPAPTLSSRTKGSCDALFVLSIADSNASGTHGHIAQGLYGNWLNLGSRGAAGRAPRSSRHHPGARARERLETHGAHGITQSVSLCERIHDLTVSDQRLACLEQVFPRFASQRGVSTEWVVWPFKLEWHWNMAVAHIEVFGEEHVPRKTFFGL